jgi:uncharacterized protein (DUF305 family)
MARKLAKLIALSLLIGGAGMGYAQDTGFQKEMETAHKRMMHDMMAMQPTGDPDKDFVMMMIPHHQGAVDMARIEIKYGKDPALKKMAQKIVHTQSQEINQLKEWLAAHR